MRGFTRERGGYRADFAPEEAAMLADLARQVAGLVESRSGRLDPALLRLLPDAYPEDPEASAEFRRFTDDDLASRKIVNAGILAGSLAEAAAASAPTRVRLDEETAQAWMRALTDIRLTLAARLGIEHDEDEGDDPALRLVYDWLGFVQGSLVDAVDR
ncbi:MAG TPA: DUF2017 family protein [Lacisediminihabitans sp.]|uniref:DUF2017 family protein n=1 Tax=Lacisediminihabitans sp. TaxID=2787631 RepID=UPI002ED9078F